MEHLPQDVDAFFRQVATAHRLLSDGYAGMRHLTTEAEQHMYDLLHHLQAGETVCGKIEARGTMSGAALAIADSKALKQAADGVAKSLGLCVAEVAADAMPRLNQLQRQLSKASVLTMTMRCHPKPAHTGRRRQTRGSIAAKVARASATARARSSLVLQSSRLLDC